MPAVGAAVAGWAAGISTTTWVATGIMVASTAYSYMSASRDAPRLSVKDTDRTQTAARGVKINTRSTQEYIRVVYGTARVGGNDVFIQTQGTDNRYLWVVQTLAEGECEGIAQVGGEDQIWLGDKLVSEYDDLVDYWFHDGSDTQTVDSNLNSAVSEWTDPLRNTCYIVWRLKYDRDKFQSLPQRTVLLKGRKVYDPRDESTAWSSNAALCLRDYLTNALYGMGRAEAKLDETSWNTTANYIDTQGWELNMVLHQGEAASDIRDRIMRHFRGAMVWYDGKYYLKYADLDEESSVDTITDDDVVQKDTGQLILSISEPSMFARPSALRVKYTDTEKSHTLDDLIIGDDQGNTVEMELDGCTDKELAGLLGTYYLERQQLDRTINGRFRDDKIQLEPHDLVTCTFSTYGIEDQVMRVVESAITEDGFIDLSLKYEDEDLYDDVYNLDAEDVYSCSLPDPEDEPPSVTNVSAEEETYNYRLRTFTKLKVSFDVPSDYPWFSHVEVRISYDNTNWEHIFDSTSDFEITNVEEGTMYYVRLKTVSIWGTKQQDSNDYKTSQLIEGYTETTPSSLGSLEAVVNSNTVNLYSAKVADPDIELYEFRLGASWSGGIFLAALRSPNLSLYGVKPGNHTFYANTLSNNDEYGDTPRGASVAMQDPPDGWTVQHTETCDYDGIGTHDNTEHTVYNEEDHLKCSHEDSVYTGTYTSPVYDLGSSGRYMVYCLADIVVTGSGTTWDSQFPDPTTWEEGGVDRTWAQIFELSEGPRVQMTLKYGETSPPTNTVEKLEILSAIVFGRYFQLEITIVDPNDAINALVENFTLKFCQ